LTNALHAVEAGEAPVTRTTETEKKEAAAEGKSDIAPIAAAATTAQKEAVPAPGFNHIQTNPTA
jgi:hypothetical protein